MMPLTWGSPTLKFRLDNTVYSVWHEFSAPHPVNVEEKLRRLKDGEDIFSVIKRETTRRFDIVVMKGDYDTLFKEKPKFSEVEKMSLEEFLDLPNKYFKLIEGKIDILIECKERPFDEWKDDVEEQIIPYFKTYKPKRMVIISAYRVPENVVRNLEREGIDVIAPFSPDECPWEQQSRLMDIIKCV
ncbi:MAG: hypothetical protein DRN04_15540 [Thermoprotei archaeon]|nr:MAG: hypothetical protein DRN04_15540 [Thermoprotei archaeon]